MQLAHGIHLAYCTNVHRGRNWEETFASLENYVMRVRQEVAPDKPYAIGLRLGADAARDLNNGDQLARFRKWLDDKNCYVFTINGFPYGNFHGERVKEQVYLPDWTSTDRLAYTNLLFDLLEELSDDGAEGSVSTLPGSFKEFIPSGEAPVAMLDNLAACIKHIEKVASRKNLDLHLGLEPEPLGFFETSEETVSFFEKLEKHLGREGDWKEILGVNYDTCHLGVEYEEPAEALGRLGDAGIRISKLHLSSALKAKPSQNNLQRLGDFKDDVYLHQVVVAKNGTVIGRHKDLDLALDYAVEHPDELGDEWRIHFHVPLHASPGAGLGDTRDHVEGTLDLLAANPSLCRHLEMETYTWEVLPKDLRSDDVVEQIVREYDWTLAELAARGLGTV
ncbi:MAG: metabolite traffic protein EboE [Opitutales bacterium]